jgi:3-oxoacyl-[acyl-carrier protein] reductase
MNLGLDGKVALVTGATAGIGEAVARALSAEGARLALGYHSNAERAGKLADELGDAMPVAYQVEDQACAAAAVDAVSQRWGAPDVLVVNAIRRGRRRPPELGFEDVSPDEWQPLIADNLGSAVRLAQLSVAGMRERGWGRIVLISSHVVADGQRGQEFYAATKAAMHGLARSLAWTVGKEQVLVNVVSPGLTRTEGVVANLPADLLRREESLTPTGRLSAPEDIASVVTFLCSAVNTQITGQAITVAGGR